MRTTHSLALALVAVLAAACTSSGASSSPVASAPPASASAVASNQPSVAPSPSADACATGSLAVVAAGKLTIGTDNPAYPPYFAENAAGAKTAPWELGDPTNGKGFESAVGYAIAERLGFAKTDVTWVVVPFANAFWQGRFRLFIERLLCNVKGLFIIAVESKTRWICFVQHAQLRGGFEDFLFVVFVFHAQGFRGWRVTVQAICQ